MKRIWGYILAALLVLPLVFLLPACKSVEKGKEKLTGVAEKMKSGSTGDALEEDENAAEDNDLEDTEDL